MTRNSIPSPKRGLYGGAITALLSSDFKDVSDIRPIPDHQEVYLNDHEVSIISELLDLGHEQSDDVVLSYYFHDLASNNESQHHQILQERNFVNETDFMPRIGSAYTKMLLIGKQSVKKYRSETSPLHDVYIIMTLIRLRNVETDVLLTLNIPSTLLESRSISLEMMETFLSIDFFVPNAANGGLAVEESEQAIVNVLPELQSYREFLYTFHIEDWQLFGGGQ